ncbi:MAG: Benzil reductase ((S)-benzoin forming) [Paracidovorax wautersii]|uniref:Benzil reductase ((S)-benzoin forming) n=1 Tax=Paracidovorax wautersii TaxID=1177982 RepID=A0A7V8JQ58_9BURK|nr:MAG: Benzil reductase ((S)-benzoin forming) [Paracidovorax wautersii]
MAATTPTTPLARPSPAHAEIPGEPLRAAAAGVAAGPSASTAVPSQAQVQPHAPASGLSQHLYILTGASRGLGLAMARQLLLPGHRLLCLSRKVNADLQRQATAAGVELEQWAQDLSLAGEAAVRLETWLAGLQQRRPAASVTLVNNAAMIPHIGPLADLPVNDITQALRVGIEAPMQLTAAFLRGTRGWRTERRVLNISSGLGRRPMASQAAYCAVKAGIDHFTRSLALEEVLQPGGAKVCALAPGVVDTDMQVQMRAADADDFPDRARFEKLKAEGQLTSPEAAAARILAYLTRADYGNQPVADIREI